MGNSTDMPGLRRDRRALALFAAMMLCSGCGSTVTGTPQPGATAVDINTLRTGPFRTEPTTFKLKEGLDEPKQVRLVEARRLINHLINPADIDPEVRLPGKPTVFAAAEDLPIFQGIHESHRAVLSGNYKFIAGVAANQDNGSARNPRQISVAVFQFDSNAESIRAARELHLITVHTWPGPDVQTRENADTFSSGHGGTHQDTWHAYGPYTILVSVRIPHSSVDELSRISDSAVAEQKQALDSHKPVPLDEVLDVPVDGENVMRRAMDHDVRDTLTSADSYGTYQPSGIRHFERDPAGAVAKFDQTGVDLIGRRASTVYRTRDTAAAFLLQTYLATKGKDDTALDPPLGIADAQCVRFDTADSRGHNSMCAVVYGRYVGVVTATSIGFANFDADLQERAAAQYAILQKCGLA
ncbi:DUF7373 family lipoprotein [Nocardia caishijiensis]|uniref:Uncharacterized protein n=1 Tax=Nocardia caishijiensis TaxID=184756 RepID=A0ABQ6YRY0_9NOCA|nr:hypothetical protein [Nocardia caishijiensis]KAF0848330.1 hypothetical protein FNL39_102478 [Nocardia caishijiensis]